MVGAMEKLGPVAAGIGKFFAGLGKNAILVALEKDYKITKRDQ